MEKALFLPLVLVHGALLLAQDPQSTQPKRLAITHITVIDATGAPAKPEMTVITTGNRITELGPTGKVRLPADAQEVCATGEFLIPGVWDMHVHWYGHDKTYLRLFTTNGVTGVRIMWGAPIHFEWRKEIQEGALLGPRMIISSTIVDGPKPAWPDSIGVANTAEARQAVIRVKRESADFLKVYSLLRREDYFAIADEAKKQGLQFAGHVPFTVSASEASDAGQRSIEHLTGILGACSARDEELRQSFEDAYANPPPGQRFPSPAQLRPLTRIMLETFSPPKAASLFQHLQRNNTSQCPTLTFLRSAAMLDRPNFRDDPRLRYMPAQLRAAWDPVTDFRFRERTVEDFELARLVYAKQIQLVGLMHRAGVEFLAGTDAQNPYCFPGFSLHDELALFVEAGLSPLEALQAATLKPARFLGHEKDSGTIQQGKIADRVLLDENPLEDIRNTTKINSVVLNGRTLERKELDEILADVEAAAKQSPKEH